MSSFGGKRNFPLAQSQYNVTFHINGLGIQSIKKKIDTYTNFFFISGCSLFWLSLNIVILEILGQDEEYFTAEEIFSKETILSNTFDCEGKPDGKSKQIENITK